MQWLGVSAAVLACNLLLGVVTLLLAGFRPRSLFPALAAAGIAAWINLGGLETVETAYADYLVVLEELGYSDRQVLVLGARGFTLSHREPKNHYTYVDIDPAIKDIAEKNFLKEPIRGEFVVDDARRFVAVTEKHFDAVVMDVYSSHTSIPSHLVTREFWRDARHALKPDGVLLANLILDPKLETPYASSQPAAVSLYQDEKNPADTDLASR